MYPKFSSLLFCLLPPLAGTSPPSRQAGLSGCQDDQEGAQGHSRLHMELRPGLGVHACLSGAPLDSALVTIPLGGLLGCVLDGGGLGELRLTCPLALWLPSCQRPTSPSYGEGTPLLVSSSTQPPTYQGDMVGSPCLEE